MKTKHLFKNILMLLVIGMTSYAFISCSEDDNFKNNSQKSKIAGTKWTSTNWDYSLGDDYVGLHDEIYQYFFHSNSEGTFYYKRKDNYSDQGVSSDKVACHFKYEVKGNEIILDYITDSFISMSILQLNDDILTVNKINFEREFMTDSDYKWISTIQGTTGDCTWYSDMCGKLWIVGEGAMDDYSSFDNTPWAKNDEIPNKVVVDEGVTTIGSYAFANPSIVEVEMPDKSLEQVGNAAFRGALIKTIWMSQSTTSIGKEAFANCAYLKDINIPESIVSIGEYAFSGCALNEFKLEFSGNLKTIGNFAFEGGEASYLTFKEGVQSISTGAFIGNYCGISKELILPNSLTSIGATAFEGPYKKIVIGTGLTEIEEKAFISGAISGEMYINLSTPPSVGDNIIVERANWNSAESRWTLYVPKGCKSAYSNKSPWNKFKTIIEDGNLEGSSNTTEDNSNDNNNSSEYTDQRQDNLDANDSRRGHVASGFSGGTGTKSDPYIISTAAELRYFSDAVRGGNIFKNQYVKLDADITINQNVLNRYGELNGDGSNFEPWIPIGRYEPSYFFCGTFDGNGHTISGLYCNRPEGENIGLFGKLYGDVKNVIIKDSYFNGKTNVGGIAGTDRADYIGPTIPSSVLEYYQREKSISITMCINHSTVIGNSNTAGIVGYSYNENTITKCLNTGYICGEGNIGGIIGKTTLGSSTTIIDCCNEGYVRGVSDDNTSIGGILGNGYVSVYNCINRGDVKNQGKTAGGICGILGQTTSKQLSNCVNINIDLTSTSNTGAILGFNNGANVSYNYFLFKDGLSAIGNSYKGSSSQNNSLTEDELKNSDIVNKLNSRVKSGWSKWKTSSDGFPTLDWIE